MFSDMPIFGNHLTTTGAQLRRVLRVNPYDTTQSLRRFKHGEPHELTPGHIRDTSVDQMVPVGLHVLNIQILKGNPLVGIHQLTTFLVREILATVSLPLIRVLQSMDRFLALRTAFGQSLLLALQASNVNRVLLHPALTLDFLPIRKYGKGSQTQVNPNGFVRRRKGTLLYLAGKTGVPIANTVSPYGECFHFAVNRAVEHDLYQTDFG